MLPPNSFKAALRAGQPQIGLRPSMAEPCLAEVSATADFDRLLIDGEHAPNHVQRTLEAICALLGVDVLACASGASAAY